MNLRVPRSSILFATVVVSIAMPTLATAQSACQPGRYASASTGACEPCDVGRYQPAIGQEACFFCEPGRFTDVPGRAACSQCGPGRFQGISGATTCDTCDPGTFLDATGQTSCTSCAPGRFAPGAGASACESCGPGRFSDVLGASTCESCEPGRYASDSGATACRSCDPGRYASASEAATCRTCGPGRFSPGAEATACDACPPGRFSGVTTDALGDPAYATTCTAPNAYNCYKTKDLKSPPFAKVKDVPLSDEYASSIAADFNAPAMVCAPVDLGNGVADPGVKQCCYKVGTQGLPKPRPQVHTVDGRFTGSQLEVLKSQLVCEPCAADLLP